MFGKKSPAPSRRQTVRPRSRVGGVCAFMLNPPALLR